MKTDTSTNARQINTKIDNDDNHWRHFERIKNGWGYIKITTRSRVEMELRERLRKLLG
jgi:hypothetical protein